MEDNTRKRTINWINKYGVTPQARFSQNFLVDDKQIKKIIESLPIDKLEQIIEIGPGMGSLTFPLIKTNKKVTAIDFDRNMINILRNEFQHENVQFIQEDFLKLDLSMFHVKHKGYIGNLPYQISRDLIKKIMCETSFDYFGFMVQKELGEKLLYKYKSPNTNTYSVLLKMLGELELVTELNPIDFYPSPRVKSWFLKIEPKNGCEIDGETFDIVSTIFRNPKKNIANNFKNSKYEFNRENFEKIGISSSKRGHELSIDNIEQIVQIIKKSK
ncbi:MAG: 16S rRNA (adenine(1518)-N(6)/adenine(1519)-N(6))-dimethyltransferase RsmA [Bacilli bacterium]|nr:16S rRNA (adenine(1518)-N(6)/adenine(1519)-N(6))-dimethyltransferase RsmA [Bacilli bacterium]